MAKNGYDQTYEDDRKENEETKQLPNRIGKAVAGAAKKVYDAATGKGAEDFEPRTVYMDGNFSMPSTEPVRSPMDVGAGVRALNMGKKSKIGKASLKSGGKVSSASSRADGCAIKGKTKGRMV